MSNQSEIFPAIAADTAKAATKIYGTGNIYIEIGQNIPQLLTGLLTGGIDTLGGMIPEDFIRLAIISAIQFAEGLTDRQMIAAIDRRLDLKYALHLPMDYPQGDPKALCQMRKHILSDPTVRTFFQMLVDRFTRLGLFQSKEGRQPNAIEIINDICTINRLDTIRNAFYQALETLAVKEPEWLRHVILPNWYFKYSRSNSDELDNRHPVSLEELQARFAAITADIRYLLEEINRSGMDHLYTLDEIQGLQLIESQFSRLEAGSWDRSTDGVGGPSQCISCWTELSGNRLGALK